VSETVSTEQANVNSQPPAEAQSDSLRWLKQTPSTYGLIGLTLLVYATQVLSVELTGHDYVILYGAKINEAIVVGEVWRLVTPLFVHAGLLHVGVNMYSLYALGRAVEKFFSSKRMLALYLLAGISGVVFSLGFSPNPSVGASGAVFGLFGALGTFIYRHRSRLGRAGRMQLRQIILVILLNFGLLGRMPQIDNWGHLGGLLAGIALTWTLGPQLDVSLSEGQRPVLVDRRPWHKVRVSTLLAAGVLAVLAFAATFSPFVR
jgi:rhomboid protease GluP